MPKYRKKPVEIEAVQIKNKMTVETLEGTMTGNPGDWLITGVNGEQYFCKDDIFHKTYEPVNDNAFILPKTPYNPFTVPDIYRDTYPWPTNPQWPNGPFYWTCNTPTNYSVKTTDIKTGVED